MKAMRIIIFCLILSGCFANNNNDDNNSAQLAVIPAELEASYENRLNSILITWDMYYFFNMTQDVTYSSQINTDRNDIEYLFSLYRSVERGGDYSIIADDSQILFDEEKLIMYFLDSSIEVNVNYYYKLKVESKDGLKLSWSEPMQGKTISDVVLNWPGSLHINTINDMVLANGFTYVLDTKKKAVIKFDTTGMFISEWNYESVHEIPQRIGVDSTGIVYLVKDAMVYKYNQSGIYTSSFSIDLNWLDFAFSTSDDIYVVKKDKIIKYSNDGSLLKEISINSVDAIEKSIFSSLISVLNDFLIIKTNNYCYKYNFDGNIMDIISINNYPNQIFFINNSAFVRAYAKENITPKGNIIFYNLQKDQYNNSSFIDKLYLDKSYIIGGLDSFGYVYLYYGNEIIKFRLDSN